MFWLRMRRRSEKSQSAKSSGPERLREFSEADVALGEGDIERARSILGEFVARMETSYDAEADALCAVARTKLEMLPVRAELRKHDQQRNIRTITRGFLRAARVSYLPHESKSRQRKRCAAYRAWFLSHALRWRAVSLLRDTEMQLPVSSLAKAQCYFARAVRYATRATSLLDEFPHVHVLYLNYWHGMVAERAQLLTYMAGGDIAAFDSARRAWQGALSAAEQLCQYGGEESFFP